MKKFTSAKITLLANRAIALALLILVIAMPRLLVWYETVRPLGDHGATAILIGFYCCAPVVAFALWNMEKILRNVLCGQVFQRCVVQYIRRICWCCVWVSIVCLLTELFYPPLVFMVIIMAFLALVISVVAAVMDAAVTIREENDLTI